MGHLSFDDGEFVMLTQDDIEAFAKPKLLIAGYGRER